MSFSAEWLALREPADHRSRNAKLAHAVTSYFEGWRPITVIDLGCGTGSNLRATAPLLGPEQFWTLVDYDAKLLAAARECLTAWAEGSAEKDGALVLFKGARRITVSFRQADLSVELDDVLAPGANLVTASALFDLVSADFLAKLIAGVSKRKSAFYTVLTYDGDQRWTPEHPADAAMLAAFHAHQARDKGFGASVGPSAPDLLSEGFAASGYTVTEGDSAWRLGPEDEALIDDLAAGFANAVAETGMVPAADLESWRAEARTGCIVGHADTFATPPVG
ncbi:MAG: SAM-dependent methyltransferase [Hyphomicrobiales bacterium]|nr:MAG: SAM-dependent methyltransferase [Hyphomicrobiales bacterium]